MFNFGNKIVLGIISFLAIVYCIALILSLNGWGYPGYESQYHHYPRYYYGQGDYYPDKSVKSGSHGGINRKGGGPHGGK